MAICCREASVEGRVSVVMPCYNAGSFLVEAVESVLRQTYDDIELVVVDDGSTDDSTAALRSYGDRLRLLHSAHAGPAAARNTGLAACSGEFVAFLDADDYWVPECIERLHAALRSSDADLSYCGWQNVGATARRGTPFVPPDYEDGNKVEALLRNAALWPIHGALTRRAALEEAGGFDTRWRRCEDYDLWLRLASAKQLVRVPEVLAYYRHHRDASRSDVRGRDAEVMLQIKKAFITRSPHLVCGLSSTALRNCLYGGLRRRGLQCYRNGEYLSAHRIFRCLLSTGGFRRTDLKYLLPALMPAPLYLAVVGTHDKVDDGASSSAETR